MTSQSAAVVVRCDGVARTYGEGAAATVALTPTSCEVRAGDQIAITGPSGSGKSTLLHLMAGLDEPTAGTVTWPGLGEQATLRPGPVAMVFQGPSLLPPLTALENVALPLQLEGISEADAMRIAARALASLNLEGVAGKLPEELSGGQAQRVAVARVLAGTPKLILADEPTGQLDGASAVLVIDTLIAVAEAHGAALVVSTHDPRIAGRLPQQWTVADGLLTTSTQARS